MRRSSGRQRSGEALSRHLPVGALVMAVIVAVSVLPTSLRPPVQPPSTGAELSPDAPPDPRADSIVAALNRATSGTAGTDAREGDSSSAGGTALTPLLEPDRLAPSRSCPRGFGDPARQVESWYSAPCAPSWAGENGGSTWKGVDADEVRIVMGGYYNGDIYMPPGQRGEIPTEPRYGASGEESAQNRTWRVYQAYFNENYQFWGRRLRIFFDYPENTGDAAEAEANARAMVVRADEEYHAFLVHADIGPALSEAARRQLAGYSGYMLHPAEDYFTRHQPYVHGLAMDGNRLMKFVAEYVCKKLARKPATHAGGAEQGQPRKFGFLYTDGSQWGDNGFATLPALVEQQCDETVVPQSYGPSSDSTQYATAITRLRAEGVTSVVVAADPAIIGAFLSQADAQSYFPEWVNSGMWITDRNHIPPQFGYSRTQWSHAFGLALGSMTQRREETDAYRAYKSVDPAGTPHNQAVWVFPVLMQIANGIQMAGPHLTPETFQHGLFATSPRRSAPGGMVGGGYGPGNLTFADDVAEVWWDSTTPDPSGVGSAPGQPGVYRYARCGERFRLGEIPREDPQVFEGGCVTPSG